MMRTSRIFILLLIALMMMGTASAAITYSSASDTITISSPDFNVSLSQLAALPATAPYVYTTGDGIWYITPTLSVTTGSLDFSGDNVVELRVNASKTKPITMATTVTSTRLADGMKIVSWNMIGDVPQPRTGDIEIYGIQSVSDLEFQNLGRVLVRNVPSNTVYTDFFFNQTTHTTYPVRFYGSSTISGVPGNFAYNVTFINPVTTDLGLEISAIDGLEIIAPDTIYNADVSTNTRAVVLDDCYNFTIRDARIDACSSGFVLRGSKYGNVYNNTINGNYYGAGSPTVTGIHGYGIMTDNTGRSSVGTQYVNIYDNIITNMGWAAFGIKGQNNVVLPTDTNHITMWNNTADFGKHNGVDTLAWGLNFTDIISKNWIDSDGQAYLIQNANNSRFTNLHSYDKPLYINGAKDTIFNGIHYYDILGNTNPTGRVTGVTNTQNTSLIDIQFHSKVHDYNAVLGIFNLAGGKREYNAWRNTELRIIDTDFAPFGAIDYDMILSTEYDLHLINVNGTYYEYDGKAANRSVTTYYYPNIRVLNTQSQPVQGAAITVNTTAKNGWGHNQTTFYTDTNGRLYDSGNRSNWMAVQDLYDYDVVYEMTSIITATKDGQSNSTVVSPDSTWYSSDVSSLSGPEIVLVLNVEGIPTPDPETPTFAVTTFIVSSFVAASLTVTSYVNRRRK